MGYMQHYQNIQIDNNIVDKNAKVKIDDMEYSVDQILTAIGYYEGRKAYSRKYKKEKFQEKKSSKNTK